MASTSIDPSIKITKTFSYRGIVKEWSNRYFFDNLKPADNTKWTTFADAVVAAEKAIFNASTYSLQITRADGYDAGSDVAVFTKAYATAPTGSFTQAANTVGDAAALVRYSTASRSTKNHPIYLFNYYHGVVGTTVDVGDKLNPAQKTAITTYATAWVAGFSDGSVTHHRCGPNGHPATGVFVDQWIRHRDFPAG